jgi:predicted dehydrogenase
MDYTVQPIWFKIRKAARYTKLYGPRRTLKKVQAQYHLKRRFTKLPARSGPPTRRPSAAIIGCGNFGYGSIAYYLKKNYGNVIRAAMDTDVHRAASLFQRYSLSYYTDDAEQILSDSAIDIVFISSNHASHAEYAVRALDQGKSVHIEKPHVVNSEQLTRLCAAMQRSNGRVALGFNRPNSRLVRQMKEQVDKESGPGMYNWFVAGHKIPPDHWYFKEEEGGRVLGNLCHWTDFLYRLVPGATRQPIKVIPTRAEKSDSDIAVAYLFGDGTIASITFSAKGHTFEGVRERFAGHRGNLLISLDDFKTMTLDNGWQKESVRLPFRDHGHEATIRASYEMTLHPASHGYSVRYVWETAQLFLTTKRALELNRPLMVPSFEQEDSSHAGLADQPIVRSETS